MDAAVRAIELDLVLFQKPDRLQNARPKPATAVMPIADQNRLIDRQLPCPRRGEMSPDPFAYLIDLFQMRHKPRSNNQSLERKGVSTIQPVGGHQNRRAAAAETFGFIDDGLRIPWFDRHIPFLFASSPSLALTGRQSGNLTGRGAEERRIKGHAVAELRSFEYDSGVPTMHTAAW